MHLCVCIYANAFMYVCMYVCIYVCTLYACMYVCMYICNYVCMNVCMYLLGLGKSFDCSSLRSFAAQSNLNSPFEGSKLCYYIHFNACTCTLEQYTCVVDNVGAFQKCWSCVAGCFCLISQCSNSVIKQ